jgi:hypothetical protein
MRSGRFRARWSGGLLGCSRVAAVCWKVLRVVDRSLGRLDAGGSRVGIAFLGPRPLCCLGLAIACTHFFQVGFSVFTARLSGFVAICDSPVLTGLSGLLPIDCAPPAEALSALSRSLYGTYPPARFAGSQAPLSSDSTQLDRPVPSPRGRGNLTTPPSALGRLFNSTMLNRRIRTDGFVDPCIPSRALKPPFRPGLGA